ncbi:MAG: ABC transporter substrate-binding protein [Actinomycetota bacterium]|nr:ABC transporter substrate-binding protein [Actinomycetota bacterium]
MTHRRSAASTPGALLTVLLLMVISGCTPPGLPPPESPARATTVKTSGATQSVSIAVGVDGPVSGFNPYLISNYSSAARAVVSLVLPSVSTVNAKGETAFDSNVVTSALVTKTVPFTVSYRLSRDAAWSDGTPVTADDFRYLQQQMVSAVATTGAAAYRSISEIDSMDAGKTVKVVFSSRVHDWQQMFSPLLPAHLLKDAPGGFSTALAGGIPVSAGPYRLDSFDQGTGLISLVRNDKYWGRQPGPAAVILRTGTPAELVGALDRGDVQALFFQPGGAAYDKLVATVPAARRVAVALPASIQLVFNTTTGPSASPLVRAAVARGLAVAPITEALTGRRPAALRPVTSMLQLPSEAAAGPGFGRPPANAAAAAADLRAAGYLTSGLYATKDGAPLRISLGYPAGDPRLAAAAVVVQEELGAIGIEVDLLSDTAPGVVARLTAGGIDVALLTVQRDKSDAIAVASAFGCQPSAGRHRPNNLTGYCPPPLQPELAAGLAGHGGPAASSTIDASLWSALPSLPLGQPIAQFAVAPALARVMTGAGAGWLWTGPLAALPAWPAH